MLLETPENENEKLPSLNGEAPHTTPKFKKYIWGKKKDNYNFLKKIWFNAP